MDVKRRLAWWQWRAERAEQALSRAHAALVACGSWEAAREVEDAMIDPTRAAPE